VITVSDESSADDDEPVFEDCGAEKRRLFLNEVEEYSRRTLSRYSEVPQFFWANTACEKMTNTTTREVRVFIRFDFCGSNGSQKTKDLRLLIGVDQNKTKWVHKPGESKGLEFNFDLAALARKFRRIGRWKVIEEWILVSLGNGDHNTKQQNIPLPSKPFNGFLTPSVVIISANSIHLILIA
jgi:hypothetical protein